MKKTILLIGTLVIASLSAGCSKDEEKEKENPLVGTWESDIVINTFRGRSNTYDIKGDNVITFYDDGRVEWKWPTATDYTYNGTYTTQENFITITLNVPSAEGTAIEGTAIYGPGQVFSVSFSNGEVAMATVTEQTYFLSGNNLTLTKTADISFSLGTTTYVTRTTYKKIP